MSLLTTAAGRTLLGGTGRMLLSDSLFPMVALVTAGFLTRELGAHQYGLLALSLAVVIWVENAIIAFFAKTTVKLVGEADDWRALGAHVITRTLLTGLVAAAVLWAAAPLVGRLLAEAELTRTLRLASIDIPIWCTAVAYRSVLIGTARYRASATGRAARWLARLCLVLLFVGAGFSIDGALAAVIGSSCVELAVYRWHVGPGMLRPRRPVRLPLRQYGTMLFASSLSLSAFNGMDVFMLTALGGTAGLAGIYGAAQNLSLLPSLFLWTFSSVLLSTVSRLLAERADDAARALACDALRWSTWLLPVAAIVAGSAPDLVVVFFGPGFAAAGPILSVLILAAAMNVMLGVALTLMTAVGQPSRTVLYSAPLVPAALVGHLFLIPRWGAQGAASVTLLVSSLAALAAVSELRVTRNIAPPAATVLRSVLVAIAAGALSALWQTNGLLVFTELACVGVLSLLAYWAAGEFRPGELVALRSVLGTGRAASPTPAPENAG
jgi:O-antigen/teichoic acid export membrane protein